MTSSRVTPDAAESARRLTTLIEGLSEQARRRSMQQASILDCRFDEDLGLDSLSRSELLSRVQAEFQVTLGDRALLSETPRALLHCVLGAEVEIEASSAAEHAANDLQLPEPRQAQTLVQALESHVLRDPRRVHVTLMDEAGAQQRLTYADLWRQAGRIAAGLAALGIAPGDRVALMLPTGSDYLCGFFGILRAAAVPVPIYPPARPSQLEEHLLRHAGILNNAGARVLLTVPEAMRLGRLLQSRVPELRHLVRVADLQSGDARPVSRVVAADDLAFLQYTSGSTGDPKGVMLTHAHLLANIRAMGQAAGASSQDRFVSWLPLYHDMGLIGAWLGSLYYGMPLLLMSPLHFLARPSRWLRAIERHQASFSAAPNFAYELCVSKIPAQEIEGLDLRSWRLAFNGAEPVSADTLRRFSARFSQYGFDPKAFAPVYGLAEAAVGLAFPPLGRGALIDSVQRRALSSHGQAVPAVPGDAHAVELVACGRALPGYRIRVVDEWDREQPERQEGRLQFQGPSATHGYFDNPRASRELLHADWLDTGDRGYLADGDLYITGRIKELIIRAGHNIYPYELERAVGALEGVRKGCVAVFAAADPHAATERLVILAETRETETAVRERLRRAILQRAVSELGVPADEVVLAAPHTVLKTSSGKIRRSAMRELYQQGRIGHGNRPVWWQLTRLLVSGGVISARRAWQRVGERLFAGYAWAVFSLLAALVWIGVLALPRLDWRWTLIRHAIRWLRRLLGITLEVQGAEHLAALRRPCVLVANHTSYLDTLVLIEALPKVCVFAAKREFESNFFARVFLRRLHTLFVERFDPTQGKQQVTGFLQRIREGFSLGFFPEGTFRRERGLLPFHMGAFVVAARAGAPLLPAAIIGMRHILPADTWRPRHGRLRLSIGPPIHPEGADWEAAVRLRDAARTQLLARCGEPDAGGH